jgi:hypothetical protein
MSRHHNARKNRNTKIDNRKCGTVQIFGNDSNKSKFHIGGNQEETNSGNACHHSVQNLLSSLLLSKNLNIRTLV